MDHKGKYHIPSKKKDTVSSLRLQLYTYQTTSWLIDAQRREMGLVKANIPSIFLQYQRRMWLPFPSSLHLRIQPKLQQNQIEKENPTAEKSTAQTPVLGTSESSSVPPVKKTCVFQKCKRYENESCVVPHRVLFKFATAPHGCMAVEFNPTGTLLAAACVDNTLQSYPLRVYDITESGWFKFLYVISFT